MPKVSIITPCYNSEAYIGQTIASIQAQTLSDWEYIVVDDGSLDNSAAVIESYRQTEPRMRLFSQRNAGCASTRNFGFQAASPDSEYLLFLDADDCLDPQMLERMCVYLEDHDQVGMVYCSCRVINSEGVPELTDTKPKRLVPHRFGIRVLEPHEAVTPLSCIFSLTAGIIPSLAVFRRSVYEITSGWDEEMGIIYEDVGLYLHIALRSEVHYLPKPLVSYRRHSAQSTAPERLREREATQQAKLYAKWDRMTGLTPDQQATLVAARAFRKNRLVPLSGLYTAREALQHGRWGEAMRFGGGAIRRYAASFVGGAG